MCGIVGLISGFANGMSVTESETLADMIFMDTLRGMDGTGVMYGTNSNEVNILKEASPAWRFLGSNEWRAATTALINRGKWAVGHNRAATRGDKKDSNTHPFYVKDKIVLVQNGTYKGDHKHLAKTEVDSEAIAHVLAEEDDIAKALRQVNAAYALVWFNTVTNNLHLIRNTERPLWVGKTQAGAVVFSSEPGIARAASQRRGLQLGDMHMLKENTLLTYNILGKTFTEKEEVIDAAYKYQSNYSGSSNFYRGCWEGMDEWEVEPPATEQRSLVPTQQQHPKRQGYAGMERHLATERAEDLDPKYLTLLNHKDTEALTSKMSPLSGTKAYAEVIDAIRVYDNPNTKTFWVFGKIFDTDETINDVMVVWERVIHTDEELVALCDTVFEVRFNGVTLRKPYYYDGNRDLNLVILFATSAYPAKVGSDTIVIPEEEVKVTSLSSLH